ncbi:MAG: response regulator [Sedimentisphaerales bacterium]|nr:response regulator [Sedimentisphaerales bacterium]
MEHKTGQRKVLVLQGPHAPEGDILRLLDEAFEVHTADSLEQALLLLREDQFDMVVSRTGDFLPLERAAVSQQAVAILNTIGEGVCLVDGEGVVLWANRKMADFSEDVRQGVALRSRQGYDSFRDLFLHQPNLDTQQVRPRRYSFVDDANDRYFEMIVAPMLGAQGKMTQVATVIWEETASRRLQQRINAIDQAGRELVRLDAESLANMNVEQRIRLLQDKIIRYARDLLHFDHFVVRLLNRKTNQLEVLFGVGLEGDERTEIFANIHNNGITGYVAATGRSYICNKPETDEHYLRGLDGARSSLTVPLRLHDHIIGTMNVESHHEMAFSEDDRQVAEIFGRYIALTLNILNLLVVERYKTTDQAAENLHERINEPLSQILTEVSLLMEEYIGHDDLRHRLQDIIDRVAEAKTIVKDVRSAPKQGILGTSDGMEPSVKTALEGKKILAVDDEQFIRRTIADVMIKYGAVVDTAQDGREALALLAQQKYDLVLSDIKLPHATGYEIFAAARNANHDIPVILMTGFGYDPNHSIVRANKEGLSAVLYKPFKVDQLMAEIYKALKVAP